MITMASSSVLLLIGTTLMIGAAIGVILAGWLYGNKVHDRLIEVKDEAYERGWHNGYERGLKTGKAIAATRTMKAEQLRWN